MKLTSRPVSEADWQRTVTDLAELLGWRHMHVRPATNSKGLWMTATSCAGWPDLLIWKNRLLAVELKTDTGRVTTAQRDVLDSLTDAGVDARVWRPRDFDEVHAVLSARIASRADGLPL